MRKLRSFTLVLICMSFISSLLFVSLHAQGFLQQPVILARGTTIEIGLAIQSNRAINRQTIAAPEGTSFTGLIDGKLCNSPTVFPAAEFDCVPNSRSEGYVTLSLYADPAANLGIRTANVSYNDGILVGNYSIIITDNPNDPAAASETVARIKRDTQDDP